MCVLVLFDGNPTPPHTLRYTHNGLPTGGDGARDGGSGGGDDGGSGGEGGGA